jgi:hypothetical protein
MKLTTGPILCRCSEWMELYLTSPDKIHYSVCRCVEAWRVWFGQHFLTQTLYKCHHYHNHHYHYHHHHYHHHHYHHHLSFMQLGHLLTRSGLTCPEASSKVYHYSFCQSGSSVSLLPFAIITTATTTIVGTSKYQNCKNVSNNILNLL